MSQVDFSDGYICVYWDVEDYPIPKDFEPRLIFKNIKSALSKMGFGGSFVGIEAYGEDEIPEALDEKLIEDGMIMYNPKGSVNLMIEDITNIECNYSDKPHNLMVISKKIPEDNESMRVLSALRSRGRNVLLVQPDDEAASEKLFLTPESISDCTRYLNGEKPIDEIVDYTSSCTSWETDTDYYTDTEKVEESNVLLVHDTDTDKEESNVLLVQPHDDVASEKLFHTSSSVSDYTRLLDGGKPMDQSVSSQVETMNEDFSRPITHVDGRKTGVFWDVDDSPLPNDLDPQSIYQKIKTALEEKEYLGEMTIWAYADKITFSDDLMDEYRKAKIYFLPGGDKNARFYRMIHDIQLWEIDTLPLRYSTESNVIVISNNIPSDIDFIECLKCSASRGYNNLLVQPNEAAPEKPETSEWPGYLLHGGKPIGRIRYL
ncbi:NYN domain limkain-b1-type [Arabidopsis thaliana x Arabidopsis arenosa]|uniref:NYN domain limkain-b1-type n=1 Tax=Arabidopsis thaliana x Arabidopsis arenosa TaxID=1240361 RepID=A0A8T2A7E1_9BRAS|nr:NYN domain limkain-b1-type [Arabidopsis thaliana x Arabidopsis arenosa]